MIQELLVFLSLLLVGFTASLLFFKYVSPKEKKELKSERDKLIKSVEKLLKKENYIEVIETFDKIAEVSEKLGDLGVSDEFRERANNLRRKLGQEVKAGTGASLTDINLFIQQLIRGPFETQAIEITQAIAQPGGTRTLIEEGEEILSRLSRLKGEPSAETATTTPPMPSMTARPPPMAPPTTPSPPPMAPPVAARPPPMAPPSAKPAPMTFPTAKPAPMFPPKAESTTTTSSKPIAIPFADVPPTAVDTKLELIDELDEPQVRGMDAFLGTEPAVTKAEKKKKPSKKDEKSEILNRLAQELPYLPEKMKKNIIKELLKRPEGKLRDTWFKVYVHKNKQYATKP
ncbi:MAG: hypothetical protein HWN66_10430 [Candidatus Helarchaeota archaeon]|nr:hypothetical protein [Candidatus Helarchaeota archaeon]